MTPLIFTSGRRSCSRGCRTRNEISQISFRLYCPFDHEFHRKYPKRINYTFGQIMHRDQVRLFKCFSVELHWRDKITYDKSGSRQMLITFDLAEATDNGTELRKMEDLKVIWEHFTNWTKSVNISRSSISASNLLFASLAALYFYVLISALFFNPTRHIPASADSFHEFFLLLSYTSWIVGL